MTKILVNPSSLDSIEKINADAIILGIKDYSVNFLDIDFSDLEKYASLNKELFISLNKNMHNKDLEELKNILVKCKELHVAGIFYYDVAVLQLVNKLSLDIPLIWSAEHLVTNQYTINYWYKKGIRGAFLSNEITKDEIYSIKENTSVSLFAQVFGYIPMYVSKRHAINNYLKHFDLKSNSNKFYLKKEGYTYPIMERNINTEIYSSFLLNALEEYLEYKDKNIEYAYINGYSLNNEELDTVLNIFQTVTKSDLEEKNTLLESMFSNLGKGFLYKESIYQVKKNDK